MSKPRLKRRTTKVEALVVIAAILLGWGAIRAPLVSAQNDTSSDDEHAERRLTQERQADRGRTEAGVGLTGIAGLVSLDDTPGTGSGGSAPGCRWAVVFTPGASLEVNVAALERASSLRGLEPAVGGSDQGWMAASLDELSHELVEQGAAPEDDLRYVTPYAPEGVDAAECNTEPGAWVTVGEVEDLALVAFSEVQESWPVQDVALGWPEPTEDTWTALSTRMSWEPVSATAASGGLTVTVTATPVEAEWQFGEIQTRVGAPGSMVCAGPGDLPVAQSDGSCRVWFAGPSTGLVDRTGRVDAITLGVTVRWQVGYASNFAGFADPDWLVWPTTSFLDGVVVNTTQSVGSVGPVDQEGEETGT
jgi:hypothetical protein